MKLKILNFITLASMVVVMSSNTKKIEKVECEIKVISEIIKHHHTIIKEHREAIRSLHAFLNNTQV